LVNFEFIKICVNPCEFTSLTALVAPLLSKSRFVHDKTTGHGYLIGYIKGKGGRLRVALMRSGKSVHETHNSVRAGINAYSPSFAVLFGMAGGLRKTNIGDILIGTHGRNYERGRVTNEGFMSNAESLPCSRRMIEKARDAARATSHWHGYLPQGDDPPPRVHEGPIVSGDKVIDTEENELLDVLKTQHSEAVGVEMEAYAFLVGVTHQPGTEPIIIRGVTDWLKHKSEANAAGSKEFALGRASAFLRYFLESIEVPKRRFHTWMKALSVLVVIAGLVGLATLLLKPNIAPAAAPPLTAGFPIELPLPLPPAPKRKEKKETNGSEKTRNSTKAPDLIVDSPSESETVEQRMNKPIPRPVDTITRKPAPPEPPTEAVVLYPYEFALYRAEGEAEPLVGYLIDNKIVHPQAGKYLLPLGNHTLKITINGTYREIPFEVHKSPLDNRLYRTFY